MNISFQKTTDEFIQLEKFVTRRIWKPKTAEAFKFGSVHTALTNLPYCADSRPLGKLKAVADAYLENLSQITLQELKAEGDKWKTENEFFLEFVKDIERDLPNFEVWVARFVPISIYNQDSELFLPVHLTASYIGKFIEHFYMFGIFEDATAEEKRVFNELLGIYERRKKEFQPETQILFQTQEFRAGKMESVYFIEWFQHIHKKYFGVEDWLLYAAQNAGRLPERIEEAKPAKIKPRRFQKPFENLSELEKNILLTEKLFNLKVIIPKEYFANLKGKNADYWRAQNPTPSEMPVVVRGNRPLKTHQIESYPMPDFYAGEHSLVILARAREKLEQMELHLKFAFKLAETFEPPEFWKHLHWNLINAAPELQADAICKVLLEEEK